MSQLNLYNYFRSSTSYRVRIAMELKSLPFSYTAVHLLNNGGEQNLEAYRALNPIGGVPTLVHDGNALAQSFAIIEYLEEAFPQTFPLFPKDLFLKAKVRQFCETINADLHPLTNLKVMQHLEKNYAFTTAQKQEWITKWLTDGLTALEILVAPFAGNFCFGSDITAADLFLIPHLFSAQRFNVDYSHLTNLARINEYCLKQDAFKKAHPYCQPDTPVELRLP